MQSGRLEYIGPLKLLLILGVVLIHCNIAGGEIPYANLGIEFSGFVSGGLALACVPSFFILSGYLFFRGVDRFTSELFRKKLRRRVSTLLVPYLLWNALCAFLFIVRVKLAGADGLGIVAADGAINLIRFLEGFWMIPQVDGFPFASAFWFIRNLICFVVLSPLFYLIARSRMLTISVIAVSILIDKSCWGAEYFVVGACLALQQYDLRRLRLSGWKLAVVVAVYLLSAMAIHEEVCTALYLSLRYVLVFSGFTTFMNAALRMTRVDSTRFGSIMIGATFFIYAFHQCFCRIVRNLWLSIVGDGSSVAALATYSLSFVTMVGVSVGVWLLMRRFAPGLLAILTGNR